MLPCTALMEIPSKIHSYSYLIIRNDELHHHMYSFEETFPQLAKQLRILKSDVMTLIIVLNIYNVCITSLGSLVE